MRRVVVTGLGAVTPIGADAPSTWRAAVAGESGIDFIRSFDAAIGGIIGIVEQVDVLRERGPDRVAPTFIPNVLPDTASGQLAIALGFRGPNYAPVSACATGSTAVGE